MGARKLGKWISVTVIACMGGVTVASCGGSGEGSVFFDGGTGPGDSSVGVHDGTVSTGGDGPTFVNGDGSDGGSTCVGKTCQQLGFNCGKALDNCHNEIDCTGTGPGSGGCPAGQTCGGSGQANVCGGAGLPEGGTGVCVPTTCQAQGYDCGFAGDGCGGKLDCNGDGGGCQPPAFCGGNGFNQCGGNSGLGTDGGVQCTPTTCAKLGYNCGYAGDGCGGLLDCNPPSGSCPFPQYCGANNFNQCGGNSGLGPDGGANCQPLTCAKLGFNCGLAGDGCGGQLNCNVGAGCVSPNTCGGGGVPGQCGNSSCTGLCQQQQNCGGGVQTTITGKVIAGTPAKYGTPDPVPNVLVYVPNGTVQPFAPGVQCSQCGAEVSGNPLVETTTAYDGTFTLANVPTGTSIPVVIQLGRWRRQFTFNVPGCTTTAIGNLVMPHNKTEGDIPLTAISTGSVDSIECVLLKMGVDQAEFTPNSGTGRIHLYTGNGASAGNGTNGEATLMGTGGTYMNYDQILFPCWGVDPTTKNSANKKSAAELANLITYGNAGGHFFATHYSYAWLYQNNPYNTTANWNVNHCVDNCDGTYPFTVQLPPTNPEGTIFSDWLHLVGAMPNPQTIQIETPRHDVNSITNASVDWIDGKDPIDNSAMQLHYTFNTPVSAASQCGHAIYSDFHVTNVSDTSPTTVFPSECDSKPMTAQEKVLEYMIWDLASCVPGPPAPPQCTPITCQSQHITCGPASDGCGGLIPGGCGVCTPPATCGGGGVPGQCGSPDGGACTPQTCQQQGITCGPAGDGCGNQIPGGCGTCSPPQTCGGGGIPGQCGYPDGGTCQSETCAQQGIFCGPAGDGCGNLIPSCGTCTAPQTCGGCGIPGQCCAPDAGSCTPKSCADQGIQCGTASDGCGNVLSCPPCPTGQSCNLQTGTCQQSSQ